MPETPEGFTDPITPTRPTDYEPPRIERVLSAEDLEREVMTGQAAPSFPR